MFNFNFKFKWFKSKKEHKEELFRNFNYDNINEFSFNGNEFYSKVLDIYDGDTITILIKNNNMYNKIKCRLNDLDTPELRSSDINEKHAAKIARNYLIRLVTGKKVTLDITRNEIRRICGDNNRICYIKCYNFDKYGRLLIDISMDRVLLNDKMIVDGFGGKYDGGKKCNWKNYFKYIDELSNTDDTDSLCVIYSPENVEKKNEKIQVNEVNEVNEDDDTLITIDKGYISSSSDNSLEENVRELERAPPIEISQNEIPEIPQYTPPSIIKEEPLQGIIIEGMYKEPAESQEV